MAVTRENLKAFQLAMFEGTVEGAIWVEDECRATTPKDTHESQVCSTKRWRAILMQPY